MGKGRVEWAAFPLQQRAGCPLYERGPFHHCVNPKLSITRQFDYDAQGNRNHCGRKGSEWVRAPGA